MSLAAVPDARPATGVWRPGPLRRFLMIQALGQVSDAATGAVLVVALLGHEGGTDPSTLLRAIAAATVPYALVGPLAGVIADHWARRRSLLVVNLVRAGCVIGAALAVATGSTGLALAVAGVLMSAARVAYTLRAAALPELIRRCDIVSADAASLYLGTLSGMVAGGASAVTTGVAPTVPLVAAWCAAAGATALLWRSSTDLGGHGFGREIGLGEVTRAVLRLLTGRVSRAAIAVTAGHRILLGALFATTVLATADMVSDGAAGYVVTAAVTGLSTFAGTCSSPFVAARVPTRALVVGAFGIPAIALSGATFADTTIAVLPAVAVTFFVFQVMRVVADSTVQACIPDAARGRVFSAYDVAYNLSYFAGAAMALTAARTTPTGVLIGVVAVAYLVGTTLVAAHVRVVIAPPAAVPG